MRNNTSVKKLSVIIPTHNRSEKVEGMLEIFGSYPQIDFLLIENNSNSENLNKYRDIKFPNNVKYFSYVFKGNGAGNARNKGVELATSEYVWFYDDDDFIYDDFLQKISDIDLKENIYRLSFIREGSVKKPGFGKKINKFTYLDRVSPYTFLVRRDFLLSNNIKFAEGIVHQDDHFACAIWSTREKQHIINLVAIEYNVSNYSILRQKTSIKREMEPIREFDKMRVKFAMVFKWILLKQTFYNVKKGRKIVAEGKEEMKRSLIKEWKTFKKMYISIMWKLPLYYKFEFIKWLFK